MNRSVLVVVTSTRRRGAEIEASELASRLDRRGWQARVVALTASAESSALPIESLGSRALGVSTLWRLRSASKGASVVIAYGSTTLPACAIALSGRSTPFVYRSIGDPAAWSRGRLHRERTGLLFRRAARVATIWSGATDAIAQMYRVQRARLAVITNGRDSTWFRPPTGPEREVARASLGVGTRPVVAVIGSLTAEKRFGLAIDAIGHLDDVDLCIAGSGPEHAALAARAAGLGPRCRLLGTLDDVRPLLWAADLVLLTSSTEGLPGVLLEAAMCGVPCLATDVGAIAELSASVPSLIVVPVETSAADLADAISDQLGRPLVDSDDRVTANHDWPAVLDRWDELLTDVVR